MSTANWLQFAVLIAITLVTALPLGRYMATVSGDD